MKNRELQVSIVLAGILMVPGCTPARQFDQDSSTSAFKYREVFLPDGIGMGADALGLNDIDDDWGIWGHNLSVVLPDEHSESVYAKKNGSTLKKQFCFTSKRLYEYIEDYIVNNYGEKDRVRFAILPNDNDIVCLDSKCVEVGNTEGDASPAVLDLVWKLSKRFPNHVFYVSDYRTTHAVPSGAMPENSGVIVSAMSYPLSYANTSQERKFLNTLDQWSQKTKRIFIWDYINNFDDYFTPYPVFGVMQRRLKNYKDHHVTAVFLNGSGSSASSLSKLKTAVLAELTAKPNIDWRELLQRKAMELYPVTGRLIAEFMLEQEDMVMRSGKVLPLYEGVENARRTYLPVDRFIKFHDRLKQLQPGTDGRERRDIDILLGELALTRLELNRMSGNLSDSEYFLADLQKLKEAKIDSYNESGWTIDGYLKDYKFLLSHLDDTYNNNKLRGIRVTPITPLDEDYQDVSILTDGVLGIPSNYHSGNLINSPAKETSFEIPVTQGSRKLVVWLAYNPGYRIFLPESVSLSGDGLPKQNKTVTYPQDYTGHSKVEFDIPASASGIMTLTLKKAPDTHSMAIDEIVLL